MAFDGSGQRSTLDFTMKRLIDAKLLNFDSEKDLALMQ